MVLGGNGPMVIDRAMMVNAGPMPPQDAFSHNITFMPLSWSHNGSVVHPGLLLNLSHDIVATIDTSN
jgi:hypothetical protein